ncbi:MAG: DUF5317 domain-containing protein [Actinomycetota bacterium]|nr:DUF5317 domain-containing protein [Actinomycetota bacterium]
MLVTLVVAIVAASIAVARGGSLKSLAETRFAWVPLLIAALVLQVMADLLWAGGTPVIALTFVAVALFLFLNRHLPGMLIAAFGMTLNLIVIGLNGAMPVSLWAADVAGIEITPQDTGVKHEIADENTALAPLGDTIPLPRTGRILSPGDLIIAAGIGILVYRRTLSAAPVEAKTASG